MVRQYDGCSGDRIDISAPGLFLVVVYSEGFGWLFAPIGATVGAWDVTLLLERVAEMYASPEIVRPLNLGNFIFMEINFVIVRKGKRRTLYARLQQHVGQSLSRTAALLFCLLQLVFL